MELIVVGIVVVVALMLLVYVRARSVAKRHSVTLSQVTGMPADAIAREMRDGNLTPGEWAAQHGLDPMTFAPTKELIEEIIWTPTVFDRASEVLKREKPELAHAIDQISVATSIGELESTLSDMCDEYEPFFASLVDGPVWLDLGLYGYLWFDPAVRKAEQLVRAAGKNLAADELIGRITAIQEREYPGYMSPMDSGFRAESNPIPPRVECETLILAARSYTQS